MTKHSPEPQTHRLAPFFKTREEMETSERAVLAPFAEKSSDSRGRQNSEPGHAFRTEFQRDRARIIHSRAFRRMEYKTQVFLNGTGDHLRTRLTHSIEVASISRTIARALRLNEDLAEAIALAHDLGHAPFGHSGEEMLAECMRDHVEILCDRRGSARNICDRAIRLIFRQTARARRARLLPFPRAFCSS